MPLPEPLLSLLVPEPVLPLPVAPLPLPAPLPLRLPLPLLLPPLLGELPVGGQSIEPPFASLSVLLPLPLDAPLPDAVPLLLPLAVVPSGQFALASPLLLSGPLRPIDPLLPDFEEDPGLPLEPGEPPLVWDQPG